MKNILINGLKSKSGGGKNIFDNYMKMLFDAPLDNRYYILTPDKKEYEKYGKENIVIVDVKNVLKQNIFFPVLYFIELPVLIKKLKIELVFNFGDVIIPSKIKQIYFFDWAYAVYHEDYIWQEMSIKDYLLRKTKVFLIGKYIKSVRLTIVQTENMATRLKSIYEIGDVIVIPSPVSIKISEPVSVNKFKLPINKKKFLFPASFASHKNFKIIISVGELIMKYKLPYIIVLTISGEEGKEFLKEVAEKKLECILNVGTVKAINMPELYDQCDVLFMPTLLESFGLPYVEAMAYGKPIITSNLDFAHEVCRDLAIYFDPFDANSIISAMQAIFTDHDEQEYRIKVGKARVANLPNWKDVFSTFQQQIALTLN